MATIRTYSELIRIDDFIDRFLYLQLKGQLGVATFGFDRWINQRFYKSWEWQTARDIVIIRDNGCDLGVPGYEIHAELLVHHMNPISLADIQHGSQTLIDPEVLITTSLFTHNAIHYGDVNQLPRGLVERKRGDTKLW